MAALVVKELQDTYQTITASKTDTKKKEGG